MTQRDFSSESIGNFTLRALKALKGRFWGWGMTNLRFFSLPKPKNLYFGSIPRLINSKAISFGDNVHFGVMPRIECHGENGRIIIDNSSSFGDYLHIGAINKIQIGENVLGGSNILIIDHNHGNTKSDLSSKEILPPRERELNSKGGITIEDNVWIADNVKILPGVTIGEGAVIGIGAIVKENIKPKSVFTGKK